MIALLHGYLLEGSGSNLWTRSVARALVVEGETVHLVCQENHPEIYDFIAEARTYLPDGEVRVVHQKEVPYAGRCVLHKPQLGGTLPVYVWDRYEEFPDPVPMVELPDEEIERYLERNVAVVDRVVAENGITALHANHAVLMPVVAERVRERRGTPFAIMPHGSAIEYAVRKDPRFHGLASSALQAASRVFVIGEEMRRRVVDVFPDVPGISEKLEALNLGVDTSLFQIAEREERAENVSALTKRLLGMRAGKSAEQEQRLPATIADALAQEEVRDRIAAVSEYVAKRPDALAADKLREIDWPNEDILLFVGRIIASKGLQTILAALPEILSASPRTRLVVVGHGPLREPLEIYLHALSGGMRRLAENIVAWGTAFEGADPPRPLFEVQAYWRALEERGELDAHFRRARELDVASRVVFTGYLTHAELRYLFPATDVAIFPSVVAEAGPLVFLEALASGSFPLGTDFAGMGASIDAVAEVVPEEDVRWMRLDPDPGRTALDIATNVPGALALEGRHRQRLRRLAEERYDWTSVAARMRGMLEGMEKEAPRTPR